MDTRNTRNIPLSSNNIQLGMERKTLAVRILAVVSKHAVIPLQVCMLLYSEKAVYCTVYHRMYAAILTNPWEDENIYQGRVTNEFLATIC